MQYRAPRWLPGGHAQTIWPALFSRQHDGPPPDWTRERWDTPDGDFIDVDFLAVGEPPAREYASGPPGGPSRSWEQPGDRLGRPPETPLLVLFHGLEGDRSSHSSVAFASAARARGWAMALPHFRGCSGELNHGPRAYHSGDYEEVGWILHRLRERHGAPLIVAGVSLGGNALMRWAEEAGHSAAQVAHAVCSICSPIDLAAAGAAIDRGFNRQVYARRFLRTMIPKALRKLQQHPGPVRRREPEARVDDLRVRQPLHRTAARLQEHRGLLGPRRSEAAPAPHPHPGPGAERAQRPLRARPQPAACR